MNDHTTERNSEYVRARLDAMQSQVNGIADRLATIEKRAETTVIHDRTTAEMIIGLRAAMQRQNQEIDRLKAERDAAIKERDAIAAAARGATRVIAEGLEKAGGAA